MPRSRAEPRPKAAPDLSPEHISGFITLVKLATSPTRLAILMLLADGAGNVGDICAALESDSQPAVSHQLALLRQGRLVETARHGREVHYGLTDRGRAIVGAFRTLADSPHLRRSIHPEDSTVMSIANEPGAPPRPYVPPIAPEELARRNAEMIRLLNEWATEGDEQEQRETGAMLREALGPGRTLSSRSLFP